MPSKQTAERIPAPMQDTYAAIVALADAVCKKHLNEEYADVSRRLAAKLARKRPSPLSRGRTASWACGIVYAVGRINFLFDPSQQPHLRADELCRCFCVSASTGSAKSSQIMELLDLVLLDPEWTLPSRMNDNLMAWLISVNGFIIDARHAPREVQEMAYEKGLIPYIPSRHDGGPQVA